MATPFGRSINIDLGNAPDQASVLIQNPPAAWIDVLHERARQVSGEGWTPEHDDRHTPGEMAGAAACYAMQAALDSIGDRKLGDTIKATIGELWPWAAQWWKPTITRRDLVKSAALAIAEIERIDRAEARAAGEQANG